MRVIDFIKDLLRTGQSFRQRTARLTRDKAARPRDVPVLKLWGASYSLIGSLGAAVILGSSFELGLEMSLSRPLFLFSKLGIQITRYIRWRF